MSNCILHNQQGSGQGYGVSNKGGLRMGLHRRVFLDHNGYLPDVVRHSCNNARCINPEHLIAGTQADNVQDSVEAGTSVRPTKRVLDAAQVSAERALHAAGKAVRAIARDLGVSTPTVRNFLNRVTYQDIA